MPGLMFQDVVCSRARADSKWYTVPLSLIVHTLVLAVIIVAPLIATTDLLPKPRAIMEFVTPHVPVVPTVPPAARRVVPSSSAAAMTGAAPLVAPETIGAESGVIFEPGPINTTGIDSIVGGDIGQVAVDAPPPVPAAPAGPPVVGETSSRPRERSMSPRSIPISRETLRLQGVVILEAVIGADGKVQDLRVLRSIPLLDEAALAAVRAWDTRRRC